ncbi:hypothetical protein JTE90_007153 [Oedothorax gibbosus]|uniref:Uncharacterized protein n=1 Tax=Oedothorax gibbosus TaxID=931172 RepID=A0AAV6UW58_9ARAC|nr:hypothetical protein JTE90_007153 [Oedothorax gibbosus]
MGLIGLYPSSTRIIVVALGLLDFTIGEVLVFVQPHSCFMRNCAGQKYIAKFIAFWNKYSYISFYRTR